MHVDITFTILHLLKIENTCYYIVNIHFDQCSSFEFIDKCTRTYTILFAEIIIKFIRDRREILLPAFEKNIRYIRICKNDFNIFCVPLGVTCIVMVDVCTY